MRINLPAISGSSFCPLLQGFVVSYLRFTFRIFRRNPSDKVRFSTKRVEEVALSVNSSPFLPTVAKENSDPSHLFFSGFLSRLFFPSSFEVMIRTSPLLVFHD